jgi:DNA polymerase-3 subunit beta
MKFTVNRDAVLDGIAKVQSIVNSKTTLPILSNIHFHAEKGKLQLTATDLEVTVRTELDADVAKKGSTTLPARRIYSVFRELPSHDIEIEIDDKHAASIKCGSSYFKIVGIDPKDFPPLPELDTSHSYSLDQVVFKEMLRKTVYSASSDETRYILNGALLTFKDGKLNVVATDGRRLAMVEQEVDFPATAEADYVIPSKTINELIRTLGENSPIKIRAAENQIAFEFEQMLVISKLIDGNFPNYRQVIPSQCEERVTIEREGLMASVRRAALVTSEQSNSIKLCFEKNRLEIVTETPDVGEAREQIPIKYSGADISIAFNPEYLIDALKVLDTDEVYFEISDELSPGVIKCDHPFLYVIMPLRTAG